MLRDLIFDVINRGGAVEESEVIALENFYDLVQDINRGLDQVSAAYANNDYDTLNADSKRNFDKANKLVLGDEALISMVKPIVEHKLGLSLLSY